MESRALHSVVRDNVSGCLGYPIPPWRPRFRAACAVFLSSPSAGHFRVQLILSCASAPPPESLESQPAPALMSGTPSLGFPPSSRHRSAESTHAGVPGPLRSVHDVSHVLDGFLLHRALRVYFTPQPRPGFALQGFSLARSRTGSSPAVALLSFTRCPCPSFTHGLQDPAPAFRALLRSPVRRKPRWFRPRPARSPLELFSSFGFSFAHRESDLHRSLRPQPFTALVVLTMCNLTCS